MSSCPVLEASLALHPGQVLLPKKGVAAHIIKRLGNRFRQSLRGFLPYYQSAFLRKGHEMDRGCLIFVIIHCLKHFN